MFIPMSVLEFRDRAAAYYGDKIGVIDGDASFTYRTWAERTHRLANALVGLGIAPGDRVSFLTYNTHHLLEGYYGVLEAGAVLKHSRDWNMAREVVLNSRLAPETPAQSPCGEQVSEPVSPGKSASRYSASRTASRSICNVPSSPGTATAAIALSNK